MKYTYRVTVDTVYDDEGAGYFTYGIEALNEDNSIMCSITDVFLDKGKAQNLAERCNKGELCVIHLMDVIEDAILE